MKRHIKYNNTVSIKMAWLVKAQKEERVYIFMKFKSSQILILYKV